MAFIMLAWKKYKVKHSLSHCYPGLSAYCRILLTLLILLPGKLWAAGFEVSTGTIRLDEGTYLLDAAIDYQFTDEVLEALEHGVPLAVEVHIQMRREGAWIWERDIVEQRLRYLIRYHALTSLYEVEDLVNDTRQHFITRDAAVKALGEIKSLPIVTHDKLDRAERYLLKLSAELDIEALPLPLRPQAYLSPSWKLSTGWSTWQLQP